MNIRKYMCLVGLLCMVLSSCQFIHKRQQGDVVAEVNGQTLRQADIMAITAGSTSSADSAQRAEAYIQQWKKAIVLYDKAKQTVGKDERIEQMVADYQRALYLHAYEAWLVENEMPKHVHPDSIQAYYIAHPERFVLSENLVRGVLLVIPKGAPQMKKLRQTLEHLQLDSLGTSPDLEKIEKYAYQNASGYELFTDQWHTTQNISVRMPLEENTLGKQLRQKALIELSDSVNTYFLRVTDKRLIGEPMPLEYATPEIEQIILNKRKIEFINNIR